MKKQILLFLCLSFAVLLRAASVSVTGLRTEQMVNPMGLDTSQPRMSWMLQSSQKEVMQTAYHILVASSLEILAENKGDLWDSGKVVSDASLWIPYQGVKLKSNQRVFWKVKCYTTKGETVWSDPARWSIGLLKEAHWKGQWIGMDKAASWDSETQWSRLSARYLRKEFTLRKQIKQATVHIAGMGMYELFINGKRIGNQVLAPAPSDYRKTIIYNSFDVTSKLSSENAIGVTLGNGRFYTMRQNYKPYKISTFGYPKLRLNLIVEYTDGTSETIVSDVSWKLTADGPIRSNNEYDGEEYDARKELFGWTQPGYNDTAWQKAERVSIPSGTLRGAMAPNMKVLKTVHPLSITKVGDKDILDMGQNMVGWIRMKVRGAEGDTLRLRFAESLQENGELFMRNLRDARVTDTYVCNGKERDIWWSPRFVYHGFRYVEVTGYKNALKEDFIGEVVSDEMEVIGSFSCSNETLNKVYKNAYWGIMGNYKGVPVDCPQRNERQPWLGDRIMGSLGESYIFENGPLYSKWMRDICEAQREDGCIPDVAPAYWNYYSDNMTWPSALPLTCDMLYTQYGNRQPLETWYPNIKRWLKHMCEEYMTDDFIITKDKYGDWCVPPEALEMIHSRDVSRKTDGSLIATAYALKVLQTMHRFADVMGLDADKQEWEDLEHRMKDAFNAKFLTVKKGTSLVPGHTLYPDSIFYGNNTVTANILPLAFGLVPKEYTEEVVKSAVTGIIATNKGHVSCGVIGVQWLLRELSRKGYADVAYLLATNKTYPSWGYMTERGATTIWELWNGDTANPAMNSGNHVMLLGDLIPWCYENLAGIRSDRRRIGFKHIIMKPNFEIQDISHVDASYLTPYGIIVSKWKKTLQYLEWEITIPANTTAEVHLPDGKIEQLGSGNYHFNVVIPTPHPAIVKDEFLYESASFPECHGATIVELENGDLVASFFGGTKERNPDCCIWVCRKPKGETNWSAPYLAADGVFNLDDPQAALAGITEESTPANAGPVAPNFDGDTMTAYRKACWNPVLFQIPNGDLILFYKIGLKVSDWSGWLVRSKDGGKTWGKREPLPKGFLGPIKNKPEYIDGRIICPSSTEGGGGWRIHFEISDDKGKTWKMVGPVEAEVNLPTVLRKAGSVNINDQEGGEAIRGKDQKPIYAIQPSILRHEDGRLQVLCRTRNALLATSWSNDNGNTWSKVTLANVPSNNSGTDAVTMKDGRHVLIYNNFSTLSGTPKGPRTPLCIAISEDGVKWKNILTLEDSPISQYSYPSIIQGRTGKLHVVYTWRRKRISYMEIDLDKLK